MTVTPLGDSALVISVRESADAETLSRIRAIARVIEQHPPAGVVDIVPAFGRLAVFFDSTRAGAGLELRRELTLLASSVETAAAGAERTVEIPVCYGGEFGPDLDLIAARAGLTAAEVSRLHAEADYRVQAIGFAPGFPYLGGLPPILATPRRDTPRRRVAAGSVGIGGTQTGIYPLETPGGWNLVGRTPLDLFVPDRDEPSLLRSGDRVRLRSISPEEFDALRRSPVPAAPQPVPTGSGGGMMHVPVLRGGMFSTVQDLGRRGFRDRGVPLSGAADPLALRIANLLVGNREEDAGLEFTLVGPTVKFEHDTAIALAGGEFGELPRWRPIAVRAGETIAIGPARDGCRGYLAIAGGIATDPVLGSRSTYVRAALGGFAGRTLRDGDRVPVRHVSRTFRNHWSIDERILPRYARTAVVRVLPGVHADDFDPRWLSQAFKVSTQSDRMGVRLSGAALKRRDSTELLSLPVAPGTIQVPPDGQPIVLLADAQTIGGYPQVAHVISVDLPVMAQLRPGDEVRFRAVDLAHAHELIAAQERAIGLLREGLAQKLM
jgi:KipI family sensor histidine kinase inhibitor